MARPRGNIDRRIVRAARQLFLRDGVDGASLREVARRARTNLGMIYYYFPTKDALFLAVVEEVYAKLLEEMSAKLTSKHTTEERLRALYERVAACSDDEHDVIRLVVREALVSSERLSRLLERFLRGHIPLVLGALGEGVEKGEVIAQPLPILMMMALAVGLAPQMMRRRIGSRPPFDALPQGTELAQLLSKMLFDGLRPR
jgi:AcrR family transcriptional regulator